jgi:hypothetical protein
VLTIAVRVDNTSRQLRITPSSLLSDRQTVCFEVVLCDTLESRVKAFAFAVDVDVEERCDINIINKLHTHISAQLQLVN